MTRILDAAHPTLRLGPGGPGAGAGAGADSSSTRGEKERRSRRQKGRMRWPRRRRQLGGRACLWRKQAVVVVSRGCEEGPKARSEGRGGCLFSRAGGCIREASYLCAGRTLGEDREGNRSRRVRLCPVETSEMMVFPARRADWKVSWQCMLGCRERLAVAQPKQRAITRKMTRAHQTCFDSR